MFSLKSSLLWMKVKCAVMLDLMHEMFFEIRDGVCGWISGASSSRFLALVDFFDILSSLSSKADVKVLLGKVVGLCRCWCL